MRGRKVLIVEDDYLQAQEIGNFFATAGARVLGPALTLGDALRHTDEAEAAILDLDISGRTVFPVAELLLRRAVPFVFYTGRRDAFDIPARFRHAEMIAKPVTQADLRTICVRIKDEEDAAASVEKLLPLLRAWSRLLLADPASADRLVERTLVEAILSVRRGDQPGGPIATGDWLLNKCEAVLERDGADLLN